MTIAVVTALAIMAAGALVYLSAVSKETTTRFNGAAIVAAARSYTRVSASPQPTDTQIRYAR